MTDGPDAQHRRPTGVDDATVDAVGKVSEAFDLLQRARGALYTRVRRRQDGPGDDEA